MTKEIDDKVTGYIKRAEKINYMIFGVYQDGDYRVDPSDSDFFDNRSIEIARMIQAEEISNKQQLINELYPEIPPGICNSHPNYTFVTTSGKELNEGDKCQE